MSMSVRALPLVWVVVFSAFLSGTTGAHARAALDAIPKDALALASLDYQKDRFSERLFALLKPTATSSSKKHHSK